MTLIIFTVKYITIKGLDNLEFPCVYVKKIIPKSCLLSLAISLFSIPQFILTILAKLI